MTSHLKTLPPPDLLKAWLTQGGLGCCYLRRLHLFLSMTLVFFYQWLHPPTTAGCLLVPEPPVLSLPAFLFPTVTPPT